MWRLLQMPRSAYYCCRWGVTSIEHACHARAFEDAAPTLRSVVGMGNCSASGQGSVLGTVGQRPLPCLPLQFTARPHLQPAPQAQTRASLPKQVMAVVLAGAVPACPPQPHCDVPDRVRSSNEDVSAKDGHAAITRPIKIGSATATLAARLATLLATGSRPGKRSALAPRSRVRK